MRRGRGYSRGTGQGRSLDHVNKKPGKKTQEPSLEQRGSDGDSVGSYEVGAYTCYRPEELLGGKNRLRA